jgi:hypothetical protein
MNINKHLLTFYFIINPHWWLMNHSYNEEWDRKLNHLLDNYKLKDIDEHTGVLNDTGVWIANYPHAYGTQFNYSVRLPIHYTNGHFYGRPSRWTIYRLRQRVKMDSMSVEEVRNYKLNQIL